MITKDTTFAELTAILRELPWGTRLHVGANKPGDFTAIVKAPVPGGSTETIAHKNTLHEAVDAAITNHIADLIKNAGANELERYRTHQACPGCESCQPDKLYIVTTPQGDPDAQGRDR